MHLQLRLERELAGVYDLLDRTGSIDWARRAAGELAAAAELSGAFAGVPAGPDLEFVRLPVAYVVNRDL